MMIIIINKQTNKQTILIIYKTFFFLKKPKDMKFFFSAPFPILSTISRFLSFGLRFRSDIDRLLLQLNWKQDCLPLLDSLGKASSHPCGKKLSAEPPPQSVEMCKQFSWWPWTFLRGIVCKAPDIVSVFVYEDEEIRKEVIWHRVNNWAFFESYEEEPDDERFSRLSFIIFFFFEAQHWPEFGSFPSPMLLP